MVANDVETIQWIWQRSTPLNFTLVLLNAPPRLEKCLVETSTKKWINIKPSASEIAIVREWAAMFALVLFATAEVIDEDFRMIGYVNEAHWMNLPVLDEGKDACLSFPFDSFFLVKCSVCSPFCESWTLRALQSGCMCVCPIKLLHKHPDGHACSLSNELSNHRTTPGATTTTRAAFDSQHKSLTLWGNRELSVNPPRPIAYSFPSQPDGHF